MSVLKIENLSAGYGEHDIIRNITFSLEQGELCALLGANGSGKTTLIKAICSLIKSEGFIKGLGFNLRDMSERERAKIISYIPQKSSVSIEITVLDVVLMGFAPSMSFFESTTEDMHIKAINALREVGVEHLSQKKFSAISEGQKQLVIIARTLVQNTKLLLLDEPDSALDFNNKHNILQMINTLIKHDSEKSILICLHDANIALRYCSRILLFKEGELVHDLRPAYATISEIEAALLKIYTNISVIRHDNHYIMVRR